MRKTFLVLLIGLYFSLSVGAAPPLPGTQQPKPKLLVTVVDENGVPVVSAQTVLVQVATQTILKGETDYVGRREFAGLEPGLYQLRVEKEGFYAARLTEVLVGATETVSVTLNHEQELRAALNVTYSPPTIDPTETAASEALNSRQIINLPYPTTRDFRNLLPFIPGVLRDPTGQVHINGSASHQIFDQLDGFDITHPVTGLLEMRLSPDALRSIEVQSSRYSAEYGKGSGGVVRLTTGMGDDRYRFSATDFVPSVQTRKGVSLSDWTPRATFSGPLRKQRAWFFNALGGEYHSDIIEELAAGADRTRSWRISNLAKAQVNLNRANILTAGWLTNRFRTDAFGLSRFNPREATRDLRQGADLFTIKNQFFQRSGLMLEVGFAASQFSANERPMGLRPYIISPGMTAGNYFKTADGQARRLQWIANLALPSIEWRGQHEFKAGLDVDRTTYQHFSARRPILIRRQDGTLAREISFINRSRFRKSNLAVSGYVQDRWSVTERWLVELGLRTDWDEILRSVLVSPRFATSYLLAAESETKISAGIGVVYDVTNLDFITRPLGGRRFDLFYAKDGMTVRTGPVETALHVNERDLQAPRFLNWSVGIERKLPASIYARLELVARRGSNGFAFINPGTRAPGQVVNVFALSNERRDRYSGAQLTLRRAFKDGYELLVSYTRSAARSNAVFDPSLDNPLFSQQAGGPLPWDAPNRLISWGWLPLVKGFDLAYSLEWRDGYPYSLVNQDQQLVGAPNERRLPNYFSLNLHAERRFGLFGLNLALRAGFNNLTNRRNPSSINNNVDSPQFLTFGGVQGRAFTGRIRFLGRK